jgi:hypothetical protein
MTLAWLVLAVLVVASLGMWWLRRRLTAFGRELSEVGAAWMHVHVHLAETARQAFDITLLDSTRPHPIERLSVDADACERLGLETPDGFVRSEVLEREIDSRQRQRRVWVPAAPIHLEPGKPYRLTLAFLRAAASSTTLSMIVTTPMRVGGGLTTVSVLVPLRDPRAVALANERADLRRTARQLNVLANALPGWQDLLKREEALKAETRGD